MERTELLKAILDKMDFLSGAENREVFFRRIAAFFPPLDSRYRIIEKAYNITEEAFRDIKREGGEEYSTHVRATFLIVFTYLRIKNPIIGVASLLHDIVEDTAWTIERVRIEFGDEVALLVSYLTKPTAEDFPGLSEEERMKIYHDRFEFAPREFFYVKLSDRFHNLVTMWQFSPERIAQKIAETRRHYLPYAEKHLILLHELEAAVESLEEELGSSKQKNL